MSIGTLAPPGGLLIVCPHPDDETLGCGQALSSAAHAGREIAIILLTDGEGSHPGYPIDRIRHQRRTEFAQALARLSPEVTIRVQSLGLPDGSASFGKIDAKPLERAHQLAERINVAAVWSTWGGDPHCDHQCAAQLAQAIAARIGVPHWSFAVWGRFGDRCVPRAIARFADPVHAKRKRHAMDAYASQLTGLFADDPDGFIMPPALTRHFADHAEVFIRER